MGVSCVASGTSRERTAPRSIVLFLEAELARLEKDAAGDDGFNGSRSSPLLDQIINDITPPFLGLTAAVIVGAVCCCGHTTAVNDSARHS